jgi:hypothetical protein
MSSEPKKTMFVLGDQVTDCILTFKNVYLDPDRKQNDDSANRETVTYYKSRGGVHTLIGLLNNSNLSENFEYLDNTTFGNGSDTLSRWIEKEDGVFLVDQFGVLGKCVPPEQTPTPQIDNDIANLKKSNIIVAYNMSDKNKYERLTNDNSNYDKCEFILLRTKIRENRQLTPFSSALRESDKLLRKTILLFTAANLRQGGFNIQKGVSWEQLATETINSLKKIEKYNVFEAIIVCFANEGCLIYRGKSEKATLFFYPDEIEGDYSLKYEKRVFASTITMQATLAYALAHISSKED